MIELSKIDKSKFTNLPYVKKVEKPWGYEIHWTPEGKPYMGKVLHINAGKRPSLQIHDAKQETWFLISGRAKVIWENDKGLLIETELEYGKGYSCLIGQKHRLAGITDCDIIEVSTPEMGTTLRLEDDYKRPDETPDQRKKERGEI
ncbi:MAG: cupin [Candidatus Levybacteria bacterium]|nr:cupin [Candidatus Levybacteria bacterium]